MAYALSGAASTRQRNVSAEIGDVRKRRQACGVYRKHRVGGISDNGKHQ